MGNPNQSPDVEDHPSSPAWSNSLKLVIAFSMVAVLFGLLIKFQAVVPQLFMVIMVAYLVNPIADSMVRRLGIPWKISVGIVYIVLLICILILVALSGVTILQQLQNLVVLIGESVDRLPEMVNEIAAHNLQFGPFSIDLKHINTDAINQQIINGAQPFLSATGGILTTLAGGAVNFMGWTIFVLLGSFFILMEEDNHWQGIFTFHIPGHEGDLKKIGVELGRIWNAFLRGQLIVMVVSAAIYAVILTFLGVSYAFGIAIFAGLARFVPYIGPLVLWVILALTSYFQDFKFTSMTPLAYTLLVVIIAMLIDAIMDNVVMPRILASTMEVHPAAIVIAAILGLDLLGILGVILAAPLVASFQFFLRYIFRKLFDLDPWEIEPKPPKQPGLFEQIRAILIRRNHKPAR